MKGLFDARVRLCIEPIGEPDLSSLPVQEQALVAKAVPKRIREFVAGRTLARRMLGEAGIAAQPLLRTEHGAVPWPSGVQASISHCGPWVGVAMTTESGIGGVGLDIEEAKPLEETYWHVILTDDDMRHLLSWPESERTRVAKRVFAAKEAAYKAQYPASQQFLPFSAMWIEVGTDMQSFIAHFRVDASPWRTGDVLRGRFADLDAHIVTGVVAPPPQS
ncbi:MAG: 4'-phosphopantetheinyl transferase [Nannocystaceae bacterium]|nr:4'-phosphopantetheinyl transferase superfamily protein [bacterium]